MIARVKGKKTSVSKLTHPPCRMPASPRPPVSRSPAVPRYSLFLRPRPNWNWTQMNSPSSSSLSSSSFCLLFPCPFLSSSFVCSLFSCFSSFLTFLYILLEKKFSPKLSTLKNAFKVVKHKISGFMCSTQQRVFHFFCKRA